MNRQFLLQFQQVFKRLSRVPLDDFLQRPLVETLVVLLGEWFVLRLGAQRRSQRQVDRKACEQETAKHGCLQGMALKTGSSAICVLDTGWNGRFGVLNRAGVCDSGRFEAAQCRFKSNSRPAFPAGRASAAPSFASPASIRLGEPESQTPALTRRVRIGRMSPKSLPDLSAPGRRETRHYSSRTSSKKIWPPVSLAMYASTCFTGVTRWMKREALIRSIICWCSVNVGGSPNRVE